MGEPVKRQQIKRYMGRLDTACESVERNLAMIADAYPPEYETYHNYVNQLGIMFATFHEMVQALKKKV